MIPEDAITFGDEQIDRADHLRTDPAELKKLRSSGRTIGFHRDRLLFDLSNEQPRLAEIPSMDHETVFLGLANGLACFAADLSAWDEAEFADGDRRKWIDLRSIMADLDRREASFAAAAKGIIGWHRSHRFCSSCGEISAMAFAGWQRICPACGTHHFPRTDPVVIMLVTHGERVLLGRSPGWDEGVYSLLAGFMEPGETVESAVRREVLEEAGINVGDITYLASQPWPFPSSLMIACKTEALNTDLQVDPKELEDARWFTREEVARAAIGKHPNLRSARRGAIARIVLDHWIAGNV